VPDWATSANNMADVRHVPSESTENHFTSPLLRKRLFRNVESGDRRREVGVSMHIISLAFWIGEDFLWARTSTSVSNCNYRMYRATPHFL
jgi:hypothetical protein